MFEENVFYYAMLITGAVAGAALWLYNVKNNIRKKDFRASIIFCFILPAAIVLSFITAYMMYGSLHNLPMSILLQLLGKEYYFTLFYFSVLSAVIFWIFRIDASLLNKAAPSLALFSIIARIGCILAGCCGGINGIPMRELELSFGIASFVYLQFFCKKHALLKYFAAYSLFRLITQFFRESPAPYYLVQIYAALVLLFAAVFYLMKLTQKYRKKQISEVRHEKIII